MRPRRWMPAAAIAAAVALSLGACTQPQPIPRPTHSATSTPIFTSDEQALKAATAAYAAYLQMSDTISHDGGANPERIKPYATGQARTLVLKNANQFADARAHAVGETVFSRARIQTVAADRVVIYACEDVSGIDIVGPDGKSLASSAGKSKYPVEVTVSGRAADELVVSNDSTVSVRGICT